MIRKAAVLAIAAFALATLPGCKPKQSSPPLAVINRPKPAYVDVAALVNARAAKLNRVWARAVTSFSWTDAEGTARSEQGEGFFQLVQPSKFALDIGKVGEIIIWAGCDDTRYWLIHRGDEKSASVGTHNGPGAGRLLEDGLPATPMDLIELAGVTPLPTKDKPLSIGWVKGPDGADLWSVETARPGGSIRREIDPATGEPRRIVLRTKGRDSVEATLTGSVPVELNGTSDWPRMASRLTITDLAGTSKVTIGLEGHNDGLRGRRPGNERLKPAVFNFDILKDRLSVQHIENLDVPAVTTPPIPR